MSVQRSYNCDEVKRERLTILKSGRASLPLCTIPLLMLAAQIETTDKDVDVLALAANCLGCGRGVATNLLPSLGPSSIARANGHVSKSVKQVRVWANREKVNSMSAPNDGFWIIDVFLGAYLFPCAPLRGVPIIVINRAITAPYKDIKTIGPCSDSYRLSVTFASL